MEKLLTAEEVAEYARVDVQTVRRWLRGDGGRKLPGLRAGRGWRIKEADLNAFLEGGSGPAKSKKKR